MPIIVNPRFQAVDDNGAPLTGGKVYFYENGTTTAKDVYSDAGLTTPITQPVTLDANGSYLIFGSGTYSVKLTDSLGVQEWLHDNVIGIESATTIQSQWVTSDLTPTYASATTFTLPGDQTTAFHPGRAIKCTITGSTIHEHITNSAYSANTTVTITNNTGSLNAGLSSVSLGLVTFDDTGLPYVNKLTGVSGSSVEIVAGAFNENKGADIASAATTDIGAATGNYVNITGTTTITSFGTVKAGTRRTLQFNASLTITYNATSMILPGDANIVTQAGDVAEFLSLGAGNWKCLKYQRQSLDVNVKPAFCVTKTVNQTNITGTQKITWQTEEFDTNGNFDNSVNYRFTPTVKGKYLITVSLFWTTYVAGDILQVYLHKNGTAYKRADTIGQSTANESVGFSVVTDANGSTDYFEVFAANANRDTSSISGGGANSFFSGCKID